MVSIIICMHGKLSIEILNTIELIIGKQKNIIALDFLPNENTNNLIKKYNKSIKKLDVNKGIIFFVDILGGSPFNAANQILNKNKIKCEIIYGTNIPMLIETLMSRDENKNFYELIEIAVKIGKKSINSTKIKINKNKNIYNNNKKIIKKTNNSKHMKIMLTRIDDRLIHGQVTTGWSKEFKISKIIVINDDISKDTIRVNLLKQVSPPNMTSHVINIDKFIKVYNNPKYSQENVLLLFTNPTDIIKIIKKGIKIKSINIGGISFKKNKIQITDSICVDKKDIKSFYKLHKMNVELEIRKVPNDKKINLIEILNNKKKCLSF